MSDELQQGRLFGLGPDAVGYIAADRQPGPYGFVLENLGVPGSFSDLGWKDGQRVVFRLNSQGQVIEVTPEAPSANQ